MLAQLYFLTYESPTSGALYVVKYYPLRRGLVNSLMVVESALPPFGEQPGSALFNTLLLARSVGQGCTREYSANMTISGKAVATIQNVKNFSFAYVILQSRFADGLCRRVYAYE